MIRSFTSRIDWPSLDWNLSAIAVICLMGPLLMGVATTLATGIY